MNRVISRIYINNQDIINKRFLSYNVNSEVVKLLKNRKIDIQSINYEKQYETRDYNKINNKINNNIYYHNKSNVSDNLGDSLKEFYKNKYNKR
jgi:hypothetical protein